MSKNKSNNCYIASLKGTALLIAIDTKLVRKDVFGRSDIGPFLRFWDIFSPILEDTAQGREDFSNMLKDKGYQATDNE